jgi:4-hydroxy-3-polyprenylbenzoate decarboxylase
VGRPPQEDTAFGKLIHELTGDVLPKEIPGLHEVNAVDAAGVHPLLLAIGSERYTPYIKERKPAEILTIANHILGTGQMSLAKYLFICAKEDDPGITTNNIPAFFKHVLERVDWTRDLHFHTNTTIDTLDYSGDGINSGSKLVVAVAGDKKRELSNELPRYNWPDGFSDPKIIMPGIIVLRAKAYTNNKTARKEIAALAWENDSLQDHLLDGFPLIILADDSEFVAKTLNNFLWVTFTRSNPAADIHGMNSFFNNKHWGCKGSLIIDARIKSHHAPILEKDPEIEKRVDAFGEKGRSLFGIV